MSTECQGECDEAGYLRAQVARLTRELKEAEAKVEELRALADRSASESGLYARRMSEAQAARDKAMARARELERLIVERHPVWYAYVERARRHDQELQVCIKERDSLLARVAQVEEERDDVTKALIDIGHEILGCDGYPCRVESMPLHHVKDIIARVKRLQVSDGEWQERIGAAAENARDEARAKVGEVSRDNDRLRSALFAYRADNYRLRELLEEALDAIDDQAWPELRDRIYAELAGSPEPTGLSGVPPVSAMRWVADTVERGDSELDCSLEEVNAVIRWLRAWAERLEESKDND